MTSRAVAAFFPTVLEEPVFGRDLGDVAACGEALAGIGEEAFVFFGYMTECSLSDKADLFPQSLCIQLGGGGGGMKAEAPANFVGHPVADSRAAILVEKEGF